MYEEEIGGEKHLITIVIPGEEKEPKGLFTWQYVWDGNICVLFSTIGEDGIETPRDFRFLGDTEEGTARERLDILVTTVEEQLKEAHKECQNPVAVVDKNPKRPMGFLAGRE